MEQDNGVEEIKKKDENNQNILHEYKKCFQNKLNKLLKYL